MKFAKYGDVVIEAFAISYTTGKNGDYKRHKEILSRSVIYRDNNNPDECVLIGMDIYRKFIDAYQSWPDGDVSVKIAILQDFVNC